MEENNVKHRPLSSIEIFSCMVTQSDPDLMNQSNMLDRRGMVGHAIMLLLVGIIAVLAWTAFWASFLPIYGAMPLGLLVGALIFGFDQAVGASDWELAGILRNEPYELKWWGKLVLRVGVSFILAQATAVGVTLWLYSATIDNYLQEKRVEKLVPLEADYVKYKEELKKRTITPLEMELTALQAERETLNTSLQTSIAARNAAQSRASAARIEADRQDKGDLPGYKKGPGPFYKEAKRQEDEAERTLAATVSEEQQAHARIDDALTPRIDKIRSDMKAANKSFDEQASKLDEAKTRDSRWVPEKSDPLLRYEALQAIKNSTEHGYAATEFNRLMTTVLMTLELMFLLVKIVFNHASVYTVRLIARTKREAAEVSAEYARSVDNIRRNRPRGNLRVVGGQPPRP
ncbi:DUF4407 domain-containing protein [Methylobacter sp.]|uniref:DUF4407 domain-containing protein n=1 Tax=Methylobacter sp. TaxID=2051955 RepID=UPI002FDDC9FE